MYSSWVNDNHNVAGKDTCVGFSFVGTGLGCLQKPISWAELKAIADTGSDMIMTTVTWLQNSSIFTAKPRPPLRLAATMP
jgi:hypothetical protein